MRVTALALLALMIVTAVSGIAKKPDFQPVTGFELDRYLGTWYEIARFPHRFEKELVNVTANYSLRDDGKIAVLNTGFKDGKLKTAEGKAKFAGSPDIGYLKVSFFLFFYGDYIIIEMDKENYSWAMVVSNSYDYFWILSRTPELDKEITDGLIEKAESLGFDIDKIYFVPQD